MFVTHDTQCSVGTGIKEPFPPTPREMSAAPNRPLQWAAQPQTFPLSGRCLDQQHQDHLGPGSSLTQAPLTIHTHLRVQRPSFQGHLLCLPVDTCHFSLHLPAEPTESSCYQPRARCASSKSKVSSLLSSVDHPGQGLVSKESLNCSFTFIRHSSP